MVALMLTNQPTGLPKLSLIVFRMVIGTLGISIYKQIMCSYTVKNSTQNIVIHTSGF